jgi:hypothetical protein
VRTHTHTHAHTRECVLSISYLQVWREGDLPRIAIASSLPLYAPAHVCVCVCVCVCIHIAYGWYAHTRARARTHTHTHISKKKQFFITETSLKVMRGMTPPAQPPGTSNTPVEPMCGVCVCVCVCVCVSHTKTYIYIL